MIRIIKYLPRVEMEEKQISNLLERYMYHVVEDTDKEIANLIELKNDTFVIKRKDYADEIDQILSFYSYAIQVSQSEHPLQDFAQKRLSIKKPIKIGVRK